MKERLMPDGANTRSTNGTNVPINQMPDFLAALTDYKKVLEKINVPMTDIARVAEQIQSNPTRRKGNNFINLVNGIARANKPKPL